MNSRGSVKIEVYLPGAKVPVDMANYAEFVVKGNHDGKGSLNPDVFVYEDVDGRRVTVVKEPVA